MPSASAAMGLFLLQLHWSFSRQILLHSMNIQLPHSVTLGSVVDRLHMCCESATYVHLGLRLELLRFSAIIASGLQSGSLCACSEMSFSIHSQNCMFVGVLISSNSNKGKNEQYEIGLV